MEWNNVPIELQAILKFQFYILLRVSVLDGNHRTTQLLLTYFGFELLNQKKRFCLRTSSEHTERFQMFKNHSFNYTFFCKEETEVENEKYANACKTKSEELQRSASLVIPNEPYHK